MGRFGALLLALALSLPLARPAHAAGHDKRAAAASFQRGRGLFEQGSYAEALAAFQAGYDAYPLPGFLVNIAQCERKLDKLDDAAAAYEQFLESSSGDPRLRSEVSEALAEVKGVIAQRDEAARAKREADEAAKHERDLAEARLALTQIPESPPAPAAAAAAPAAAVTAPARTPELVTTPLRAEASRAEAPRRRWWLWTTVGVVVAGALAAGIAVAVVESQPHAVAPGSLGLLDGRASQ